MNKFYKNKKILITGHSGFKGSWLTLILQKLGAEIIGYSLPPETNPNLYELLDFSDIKSYFSDIRDYNALESIIKKEEPEIIFHLAAQPLVIDSYNDPIYTYSSNVLGTANILESIRKVSSVKTGVIVTTDKVYQAGENKQFTENDTLGGFDPYSTSKVCAELIVKSYNLSFFSKGEKHIASARAGNVIGGGDWSKDRLIPDIVRSIFEGNKPLVLRYPKAIRPWQHVLDPLYGYIELAKKLHEDQKFASPWNFAPENDNSLTVQDIVKKSISVFGKGEYTIQEQTMHETAILKLDSTKAKKYLNWNSKLGINDAMDWTLNWYKDFYSGENAKKITSNQIEKYLEMVSNAR